MPSKPRIAITLGDIGGIGPEVVLKAITHLQKTAVPYQAIIVGPALWKTHPAIGPLIDAVDWTKIQTIDSEPHGCNASNTYPNAENGRAAVSAIETAVTLCQEGHADAMVTAPISKESLQLATIPHTGHTTLLSSLTKTSDTSMAFYSPKLNVILNSIHIPLSNVPNTLTRDSLSLRARHAIEFTKQLGISAPRIAIAGLNPHAGENGLLGTEEAAIISPFINEWNTCNPTAPISGPIPPDVVFRQAIEGRYDIVIALYHDQGLIPLKLVAFDAAVNTTIGLPFIRTSPDHGTAYDIAYTNQANPSSMIEATSLAIRLCS